MTNGDAAVAAGMDVVLSTADRRQGYDEINKTRDYIAQRTSAVTPVDKGGTGATTPDAARAALGAASVADLNTKLTKTQTQYANDFAYRDTLIAAADNNANGRVSKAGDTITGNLNLPNSTAATSGYVVAYINGDGRVSKGASARRYKKYISAVDPLALGDIFPQLVRYQMRTGDGDWKLGHIADDLAGTDAERFMVLDTSGEVESIDFIALLLTQTAQLHQALDLALQRIEHLENR